MVSRSAVAPQQTGSQFFLMSFLQNFICDWELAFLSSPVFYFFF
jgi:hypothetical protein